MDKTTKTKTIKDFAINKGDVGSADVQIALLTARIKELTEHLKLHPKDVHSEHGLVQMVNKRRKLLKYLNRKYHDRYLDVVKRLGLRH